MCVDVWMCVWMCVCGGLPVPLCTKARHGTARHGIYTILAWTGLDWGLTHIQSLGQVIRESRINHPRTLGSGIPHTLSDKIYTNPRTTYPSETKLIPRVTARTLALFSHTPKGTPTDIPTWSFMELRTLCFWSFGLLFRFCLFVCLGGCVYAGVFVLFSVLFVWVVGVFRLGGWGGHAKLLFWKAARAICVLQIARTRA
jgi:hypothetical protein